MHVNSMPIKKRMSLNLITKKPLCGAITCRLLIGNYLRIEVFLKGNILHTSIQFKVLGKDNRIVETKADNGKQWMGQNVHGQGCWGKRQGIKNKRDKGDIVKSYAWCMSQTYDKPVSIKNTEGILLILTTKKQHKNTWTNTYPHVIDECKF